MDATYDAKTKKLTLVLNAMDPPQPSTSGKSLLVATTHGAKPTTVTIKGQVLVVSVNAYIPAK